MSGQAQDNVKHAQQDADGGRAPAAFHQAPAPQQLAQQQQQPAYIDPQLLQDDAGFQQLGEAAIALPQAGNSWTPSEVSNLEAEVNSHGGADAMEHATWALVAKKMPGRSADACRQQWEEQQSEDLNRDLGDAAQAQSTAGGTGNGRKDLWLPAEDKELLRYKVVCKYSYDEIHKRMPKRTVAAIKLRWHKIKETSKPGKRVGAPSSQPRRRSSRAAATNATAIIKSEAQDDSDDDMIVMDAPAPHVAIGKAVTAPRAMPQQAPLAAVAQVQQAVAAPVAAAAVAGPVVPIGTPQVPLVPQAMIQAAMALGRQQEQARAMAEKLQKDQEEFMSRFGLVSGGFF